MKQTLVILTFSGLLSLALAASGQSGAEPPDETTGSAPFDGRVIQPAKRSLDTIPVEALGPGITRQVVHGTQSTFSRWQLKTGTTVPLHHHVNEQTTWIISGRAEVVSGEVRYELRAGDIMIFAPNVEHSFTILEDTVAVDFFAPARQDWIDAAARSDNEPRDPLTDQ
ncbi:MAG: cupin domain-containing protein [Gammaproteobacteria bacterium]|jgi:quercetin dioxygenase-like cupin family protein|nr:cupin domain-containing protein [Gammaproteobacteria bacterium]